MVALRFPQNMPRQRGPSPALLLMSIRENFPPCWPTAWPPQSVSRGFTRTSTFHRTSWLAAYSDISLHNLFTRGVTTRRQEAERGPCPAKTWMACEVVLRPTWDHHMFCSLEIG